MKSLTVAFITSRPEPRFEWFFESLTAQCGEEQPDIIVVDLHYDLARRFKVFDANNRQFKRVLHVLPKPNVWQGKHRLTKEDWWAKSNAMNTAICLCRTEWIAFVDDRCVIMPGWSKAVERAMTGNYAVTGSYEKREEMVVEKGIIKSPGKVIGVDSRNPYGQNREAERTFGGSWFGMFALPLRWLLEMNGIDETCDGIGSEDTVTGNMIAQNGHDTFFDPMMKVIQDRSRPDSGTPLRTDKGVSPNDKSHALLVKIGASKRAVHTVDICGIRNIVQSGGDFLIPTHPTVDWYDGESLKDIYVR